jgi:hypothetical protein
MGGPDGAREARDGVREEEASGEALGALDDSPREIDAENALWATRVALGCAASVIGSLGGMMYRCGVEMYLAYLRPEAVAGMPTFGWLRKYARTSLIAEKSPPLPPATILYLTYPIYTIY